MSENEPRCTQNFQESLNNDGDMSAPRTTISQGGRLKWKELIHKLNNVGL